MKQLLLFVFFFLLLFSVSAQYAENMSQNGRWVELETDEISTPEKYLTTQKIDFGLSHEDGFAALENSDDHLGFTHHRYIQTHQGVRVEGAQYLVHTQGNRVIRSNGRLVKDIITPSEPLITAEEAIDAALLYTNAKQYYWEDAHKEHTLKRIMKDPEATFYPEAELVYADRDYTQDGSRYRLAWKMEIHAMGPKGEKILFIDARDGHILFELEGCQHTSVEGQAETRYHGLQTFMTDSIAPGVYRLHDNSRGVSIETYNMQTLPADTVPDGAVDFFDDDNYWDHHNDAADDAATDVHWGIQQTYDYFLNQGRNSYDGSGSPIISYVHVRENWFNARWTGRWMEYGDGSGNPLTSIDVVSHELTHGVTGTSSGLVYRNESGALNESFSDIFGTAVERYAIPDSFDWLLGKLDFQFRSLSQPNDMNDPNTYQGNFWEFGDSDNGGVHTNSGVQNYWFYLLSEGGNGTNDNGDVFSLTGIGMDKAEAIAFRNLTTYLTVSSTFADARYGAILSAEDLYGPCSDEVLQTIHAWYAVGVGPDMITRDLELMEPITPDVYSCEFSDTEDVTLNLLFRRSGCQNGLPAGTKLPVSYTINNGIPILDTITLMEGLVDGESLTYTFSTKADLSEPAYYDFDFTATFPGDQNPDNDVINKFTIVSVETLADNKLIHFNEFVRPSVPPYYVIEREHSAAGTAREAAASGLRGFLMTGKDVQRNNIDYATSEEENFTKNTAYESRLCMCVDAVGWDSLSIEFDLRQGFSDIYEQFSPEVENVNFGIALRLIADEVPVSPQFHPDTFVNDTIDIDTFVHHRISLDHLAGTSFNLCFQGKHFISKFDDFLDDSDGDYSHVDNIELKFGLNVSTRDNLLNASLLNVYPNPTSNMLTVEWSSSEIQPSKLIIHDLSGRAIEHIDVSSDSNLQINVSHYNPGLYFLEAHTQKGLVVKKILVQ